jgi:hypothetical protein
MKILQLCLLGLASYGFAEQLLTNNDFKAGMTGWSTAGSGSFSSTPGSDQWGSFIDFNIANGGANPWDVKLYQDGLSLQPGYEYVLEWGGSRSTGTITVGLGMSADPYTSFLGDEISFSGDYLDHTITNGSAATLHYCGAAVSGLQLNVDMGGNNTNARVAWVSLGRTAKSCTGGGTGGGLTNPGIGPVSYYGELKKSGNKIIGARTKTATQVRGMSLYWTLWSGENFYNKGAVDALVSQWKIELIRAAMGVNEAGGYVDRPAEQLAYVETVIQAAIANDIYVLVDFHCHKAENYQSQAITFFRTIAQKYGKNDHVIFELYNEPLAVSWSTVKNYAIPVIAEIRKSSDNLIVVGTPNWSQDVDAASSDPINDANVAYGLHFYAGSHGAELQAKARTAMNNGAALMVTEWGSVNANGDGAVSTATANSWMSFMDQYKLSWANWSVQTLAEGASAFKSGVSNTGEDWNSTGNMTASGQYVYSKLTGYASTAAWRLAPPSALRPKASLRSRFELLRADAQGLQYRLPGANDHRVELLNLKGTVVSASRQPAGSGEYSLQTGTLPQGLYLLRVQSRQETATKPIMIHY